MSEVNAFPSSLDSNQVIQQAYNSDLQRLRVDAEVSAVIGDIEINSTDSSITIGTPNNSNTLDINPDGSINVDVILNASNDSVAIKDPNTGNTLIVNSDGSINVEGTSTVTGNVTTNEAGLNSFQTVQYTIGITAQQITSSPLIGRSSISLRVTATGSNAIFIGNNSGLTVSNGYPLYNGDTLQMDLTPANTIYAIANSAGQTLYVLEIA